MRAVLVTIHHQATVQALIRSLVEWHLLHLFTTMTHFGRITFINNLQFFPIQQTLVCKHLYKSVETPVVVDQAITYLTLSLLLRGLALLFLPDHLLLGKISDDNSPFNQFASDEMGRFVQTILLLVALAF